MKVSSEWDSKRGGKTMPNQLCQGLIKNTDEAYISSLQESWIWRLMYKLGSAYFLTMWLD